MLAQVPCGSACILFGFTSCPRALAALPMLIALAIRLEYPPPGEGTGQLASPVPDLQFVTPNAARAGLGKDVGGSGSNRSYRPQLLRSSVEAFSEAVEL